MRVAEFVSYLSSHGMVDPSKLTGDTIKVYDNRMKVQNYAFLARLFGLDMGYVFSGQLDGPFSPDLADDLDAIDAVSLKPVTSLPGMRESEFMSAVKDKSFDWLVAAASIVRLTIDKPELVPDYLHFVTKFEAEFIDSVYRDLKVLGLIPMPQLS